jgi:membrane-anchored protein YejM (alkaline phosphatase superfamily)
MSDLAHAVFITALGIACALIGAAMVLIFGHLTFADWRWRKIPGRTLRAVLGSLLLAALGGALLASGLVFIHFALTNATGAP